MKRNWELIREFLINLEQRDNDKKSSDYFDLYCEWYGHIPNEYALIRDNESALTKKRIMLDECYIHEFNAHIDLMRDMELISGRYCLTSKGYDLLELIRDNNQWLNIKEKIKTQKLPFTIKTIEKLTYKE